MKKQSSKTSSKKAKEAEQIVATPDTSAAVAEEQNQLKVDVEYLKTTNLHCVVHCPNGTISDSTFVSFIKFGNVAKQIGLEWSVETTVNESVSSRAKNMLAAKFMTLKDKTHILYVDPDISFEPWHVLVLLDRRLDAVSGLYPTKTLPIRWSVTTFDGAEEKEDGLHEVDRVGTGFLLLSRNVFEQLKGHEQVKQVKNDIGMDQEFDAESYVYFSPQIAGDYYASEDAVFSALYRSTGNKLWVDKRVTLASKGFFNYSAVAQDVLLNSFGNLYLDYMKNSGKIQILDAPAEQ